MLVSCRLVADERIVSNNAIEIVKLLWEKIASDNRRVSMLVNGNDGGVNPITEAAKHGNLEFLSILIAFYPDVLYARDSGKNTIFDHAVMNRHIHVFNLIHIGSVKRKLTLLNGNDGNKMLHLAANLGNLFCSTISPEQLSNSSESCCFFKYVLRYYLSISLSFPHILTWPAVLFLQYNF